MGKMKNAAGCCGLAEALIHRPECPVSSHINGINGSFGLPLPDPGDRGDEKDYIEYQL